MTDAFACQGISPQMSKGQGGQEKLALNNLTKRKLLNKIAMVERNYTNHEYG